MRFSAAILSLTCAALIAAGALGQLPRNRPVRPGDGYVPPEPPEPRRKPVEATADAMPEIDDHPNSRKINSGAVNHKPGGELWVAPAMHLRPGEYAVLSESSDVPNRHFRLISARDMQGSLDEIDNSKAFLIRPFTKVKLIQTSMRNTGGRLIDTRIEVRVLTGPHARKSGFIHPAFLDGAIEYLSEPDRPDTELKAIYFSKLWELDKVFKEVDKSHATPQDPDGNGYANTQRFKFETEAYVAYFKREKELLDFYKITVGNLQSVTCKGYKLGWKGSYTDR